MKNYFFVFLFCTVNAVLCVSSNAKQNDFGNDKDESTQNLSIDVGHDIKKTKILFLEPCNVSKAKITNDRIRNEDSMDSFPVDDVNEEEVLYDKHSNMSQTQKNLIGKLITKVRKNLDIIDIFDFYVETNVCGKIDEYLLNHKNNINGYVLNNYNEENDYVVVNNLTFDEEGKLKLDLFIWDMLDKRIVGAQYYVVNESTVSRISGLVSDFIYTSLTNEEAGMFDTKIMYVAETGKFGSRKKAIKVMDFNGDNSKKVTNGDGIVVTPTFSRFNKDEIFYLEYKDKTANFFRENISTGKKSIIKVKSGIMFAPNFNPQNTNQFVLSIAGEDGTNLFTLDMVAGKYSKITNNKFINTSPNFSPNGTELVYVSDKTGTKKLYVYDTETKKSRKISNGNGAYDKPVWSLDGRLIAFVKIEGNKFKLGLMTPDGENERYITESYLIEGLKWSPNSRYIMYSKQSSPYGKGSIPKLYIIDIVTNKETLIKTPDGEGAVDPDWIKLR